MTTLFIVISIFNIILNLAILWYVVDIDASIIQPSIIRSLFDRINARLDIAYRELSSRIERKNNNDS